MFLCEIAEARRVSCGSIQRLSLPEKMPGLQQPGGPPVSFKSPSSHGYRCNVSHHHLLNFLTKYVAILFYKDVFMELFRV